MQNNRLPSGITTQQFEAYKLCSGEHDGHTTAEAAKIMGITQRSVERLLERMEKILPSLFPLLTKDEAAVYAHYQFHHVKPDFPQEKMEYLLRSLTAKGKLGKGTPTKMLEYSPIMDNRVKRRF